MSRLIAVVKWRTWRATGFLIRWWWYNKLQLWKRHP